MYLWTCKLPLMRFAGFAWENMFVVLSPPRKGVQKVQEGAGLWYLWMDLLFTTDSTSTPRACGKETNLLAWNLMHLFLGHPRVCFTCHRVGWLRTRKFAPDAHQENWRAGWQVLERVAVLGMVYSPRVCGHKGCFSISYAPDLGHEGIWRAYKSSHKRKALLWAPGGPREHRHFISTDISCLFLSLSLNPPRGMGRRRNTKHLPVPQTLQLGEEKNLS